jgi:hypothetical protein
MSISIQRQEKRFGSLHLTFANTSLWSMIRRWLILLVGLLLLCANARTFTRTLQYPTGLLIAAERADFGSSYSQVCLLQHDVIDVHPRYKGRALVEENILPKKLCADVIEKAEAFAAAQGGWTRSRHTGYPTTDLPLRDILGR